MFRPTARKKRPGFTLVEIMVCLAIFGLLMSIASVGFAGVLRKSRSRLEDAARRRSQDEAPAKERYKSQWSNSGSGPSMDERINLVYGSNRPSLKDLNLTFPKNFGNNPETRSYYKEAGLDFKAIHFMRVALAFKGLGMHDVALKNALLAAELKPNDSHIHSVIGAIFRDKGELENSVRAYQRALECEEKSPEAHFGLGETLVALGEVGNGLSHLLEANKLHPDNPEYLARIGQVYFDNGDPSQARDYIARAVKKEPEVVALLRVEILEKLKIKMPKGI